MSYSLFLFIRYSTFSTFLFHSFCLFVSWFIHFRIFFLLVILSHFFSLTLLSSHPTPHFLFPHACYLVKLLISMPLLTPMRSPALSYCPVSIYSSFLLFLTVYFLSFIGLFSSKFFNPQSSIFSSLFSMWVFSSSSSPLLSFAFYSLISTPNS